MNFDLSSIGLATIRRITDLWAAGKADSLIDYTQPARVEPIVLIDSDCLYLEPLHEVQQSLLSIFAGYYLQAIAISTSIGKIEVMRHLDRLNPSRNPVNTAADSAGYGAHWLMATENYRHRLPTPNDPRYALEAELKQQIALESDRSDATGEARYEEVGFGRDTMSTLKELANLSVGKMFSVEITDGLHKAAIPIAIRMMASSLPTASLVHILSLDSEDNSMKERYHAWRSGRIEFIRDLCLCQDLIDTHRKNLMADKDGIYTALLKRNRSNQISTLVSGNPSVATASNMVVMSDTTADQVELKVNGRLKDFKTRESIFKKTYLMIMAIIDKQYDRVTFYHRGLHHPTEVGLRDLKAANRGNGPDVSEILKAYQMGNHPSL